MAAKATSACELLARRTAPDPLLCCPLCSNLFRYVRSSFTPSLTFFFETPRSLVSVLTAPLTYDTRIEHMTSELRGKVCGQ